MTIGLAPKAIGKTAAWMAAYRALESRRSDRHFNDPFAARFAATSELPAPRGFDPAYSMVTQRTATFDEIILRLVRDRGVTRILNLAAGFDTRPYRLDLPECLEWIEADLPDVISLKASLLQDATPKCRFESVGLDLGNYSERNRLLQNCGQGNPHTLVITEGLLLYLDDKTAYELAHALHGIPSIQYWLTDIMSPIARDRMNKAAVRHLNSVQSRLKFAPLEGAEAFTAIGWTPFEQYLSIQQMIHLNRSPGIIFGMLLRITARLARPSFDGTILLRRS